MSDRGGLPAISPYDIQRHWWLHELRRVRAAQRVNKISFKRDIKQMQKELCNVRQKAK